MTRLIQALDGEAFDAVHGMRVQMPDRTVRCPDVVVAAGAIAPEVRTLQDAVVICEVLSPDTAETDRGQTLPSLRCYVLIEQSSRAVMVWRRQPDATWRADAGVTETLPLPEIGTALRLADIYAGLQLGGGSSGG